MEAETGVMQPPRMPRAIHSTRQGIDGPLKPSEEVKPQWHLDFRLWPSELCENKSSWFWVPKFMVICYSGPSNLYSSQSCSLVPKHFCSTCIPQSLLLLLSLLDYLQTPHSSLLVDSLPSALPPPSQDLYLCKMSGRGLPWQSRSWESGCLPTQETQVQSLVQDDSLCHGATRLVCHNYGARALEPASHNYWAREPQLLMLKHLQPVLCNERSHCSEKPAHHSEEQPNPPQLEKAHT